MNMIWLISSSVIYHISPYSGIWTLTFLLFVTFSIHCYISFTLLWLSDDSYLSVTTFSVLCTFKLQPLHICHSLLSFYIWGQCYHCTSCSLVTICNFPYFHLSAPLLPDYISPCLLLVVSPQFENQPRLTPLTFWLNQSLPSSSYLVTHPITPSYLYLRTSEIRTPGSKNEGPTHKLKPSPDPYIVVHLSYLTHWSCLCHTTV